MIFNTIRNKKTFISFVTSLFIFSVLTGCSLFISRETIPDPVSDVKAYSLPEAGKIVIKWVDPMNADLLGIKIYNGEMAEPLPEPELDPESDLSLARSACFDDGILVGKGIQFYEISNLEDGKYYTFKLTAVTKSLGESEAVSTEPVLFKLKTVEVEKEVEVEVIVNKYICPIDGKEYDTAEDVNLCCGDKIFFKNTAKEGSYTVYHLKQNKEGGNKIANYSLNSTEEDVYADEGATLEFFQKEQEGFTAVTMAQQEDSIYVLYDRNTISYTFESGSYGTFQDGSSTLTVTGLYGTDVAVPANPEGLYKFIQWNSSEGNIPSTFGSSNATFSAVWIDNFKKIVMSPESQFYISSTETTYAEWYEVYNWAKENGYTFQNKGKEGNLSKVEGTAPTPDRNLPVTGVSWRDAVVWCNAASEKAGLTPVYIYEGQVLRSAQTSSVGAGKGMAENATIDPTANGYRLPTVAEWQFAAAGGEEFLYSGSDDIDQVAWYGDGNGSNGSADGSIHDVQLLSPNGYGLYDMSGNVWEWCQDQDSESSTPQYRMMCGGSFWAAPADNQATSKQSRAPYGTAGSFAFRAVRNAL